MIELALSLVLFVVFTGSVYAFVAAISCWRKAGRFSAEIGAPGPACVLSAPHVLLCTSVDGPALEQYRKLREAVASLGSGW
jgi:hypothetical protein